MTVHLEDYRAEICDLFHRQHKPLAAVKAIIENKYGVTACDRTWKSRLKRWKIRRCDMPGQSPSTDAQTSTATSPSPSTPSTFAFPLSSSPDIEATRFGPLVPSHFVQRTNDSHPNTTFKLLPNGSSPVRPDSPILGSSRGPIRRDEAHSEGLLLGLTHNVHADDVDLQLPIQSLGEAIAQQSYPMSIEPANPSPSSGQAPIETYAGKHGVHADPKAVLRSNINKANLDFRPQSFRSTFSNDSGYYTSSNRASMLTLDSTKSSFRREDSLSRSSSLRQRQGTMSACSNRCAPIPEVNVQPTPEIQGPMRSQIPTYQDSHSSFRQRANAMANGVSLYSSSAMEIDPVIESGSAATYDTGPTSPIQPITTFFPPHAAPSRCLLAHHQPYDHSMSAQDCTYCSATSMHHLATITPSLTFDETCHHLELLKKDGRDINARDMFGNSPLHFLASSGPSLKHIQAFFGHGADRFAKNDGGETFLHVLDVRLLGVEIRKVLQLYVRHCNPAQRTHLLRQRTHQSRTILHCLAAQKPSPEVTSIIVDWFKSMHVNVQARDNQGRTPWHYFAEESPLSVPKKQKRPISDEPANIQQLQLKNSEREGVIGNCSSDPFCEDKEGHNSLACLAYNIYPTDMRNELINHCISRSVDLDHFDKQGRPPIHSFILKPRCSGGETETEDRTAFFVRKLLDAGASVDLRNRDDETALHLACKWGRPACTRLLLKRGADPNAVNIHGRSVLAEALTHLDLHDQEEYPRIKECMSLVVEAQGEMEPPDDADRQHQRQPNFSLLYNSS